MAKEKKTRNQKLYNLWKQKGLSYRQLGKIFEINESACFQIVKKYESKRKK